MCRLKLFGSNGKVAESKLKRHLKVEGENRKRCQKDARQWVGMPQTLYPLVPLDAALTSIS